MEITKQTANNAQPKVDAASAAKKTAEVEPRDSARVENNKTEAHKSVEVELSEAVKSAESNAIMDAARVQEIRAAVEAGRFPLDAKKIAENFAELEKLL